MGYSRPGLTIAIALAVAGCATFAGAPTIPLTGSSWRVVAVNGQPTPAVGDYSMRFQAAGQLGARFGCNHMGGQYRLVGSTLTITDVAQTLMGCPDPAGTFEEQAGRVLAQPMQVAFASNERMYLSNSAGSITLDPMQ